MEWISVKDRLPIDYITGDFDGKKTDEVLVSTSKEDNLYVAVMYVGVMDGSEFFDWYDVDDFGIDNVTHWMPLPQPPTK